MEFPPGMRLLLAPSIWKFDRDHSPIDLLCRRWPRTGSLCEALEYQRFERRSDSELGAEARTDRILLHMRQSDGNIAVPGEDRPASQQVIGHAADRVEVRAVINIAPAQRDLR